MFADPDFADFSQEIGLASLGASDEDIQRLATCYWHSVEFGLIRHHSDSTAVRAYGAGLLSSFGELEYACKDMHFPLHHPAHSHHQQHKNESSDSTATSTADALAAAYSSPTPPTNTTTTTTTNGKPNLLAWDPKVASATSYPICSYQPTYFVAENLADAKLKMREFCEQIKKPFHARYNSLTNTIWVDRAVKGGEK